MFNKLKTLRKNVNAPQHVIDTAKEYQAIMNTKFRNDYLPQIQSFIDTNKKYLN